MKKRLFVIGLVVLIAVVGVFALSSCTSSSEEFSPFRDKKVVFDENGAPKLDDKGEVVTKEGIVGYTFNPKATKDDNKNNVFDGVKEVVPVTDGGDYKAEKAFPVTHVAKVYNEDKKDYDDPTPYPVMGLSSNAFYGEKNLEKVVLPDCYYIVGTYAFFECSNLKEIVLPAGLKEIRQWAFYDCNSLEKVVFGGTTAQWNALLTKKDNGKRDINELGNSILEKLTKDGKVVCLGDVAE